MWIKRLLLLALVLPVAIGSAAAHAQTFYLSAGALFTDGAEFDNIGSTEPVVQAGTRFWYTDLFQLQGGFTYQGAVTAEAALLVRPYTATSSLEPYFFAGFGRYFGADETTMVAESGDEVAMLRRTVLPVGVGGYYHLNESVSLNLELGARWTLLQSSGLNGDGSLESVLGFLPTVGISYNMNRLLRPQPEHERPAAPARQPAARPTAERTGPRIATGQRGGPPARQSYMRRTAALPRDSVLAVQGEMVLLPDGIFVMGLTDEDPLSLQTAGLKRVTISKFLIDRYEVTNSEYRAWLDSLQGQRHEQMLPDSTAWQRTGNRIGWTEYFRGSAFDDHPVVAVTHDQAEAFCEAMDKRLPTEGEWEYAARSGRIGGVYPWDGLEPRDATGRYLANYNPGRGGYAADGYAFTAPVDAFEPSAWGLYNMAGNVAEWVQDAYNPSYANISDFNPLYQDEGENRHVVRGGSWSSDAFYIGVGVRDAQPADQASPMIGFRCAQDYSSNPGE